MKLSSAAVLFALLAFPVDAVRSRDEQLAAELSQEESKKNNATHSQYELRLNVIKAMGDLVGALSKEAEGQNHPYGRGYSFGGWHPPRAQCNRKKLVIGVAKCLYNMANGNLQNVFRTIAGADGKISYGEWKQRVGGQPASLRIFLTIASQERPSRGPRSWGGGDDSNTIDWDDWMGIIRQAHAASGARMDMHEWAEFVAASVTAESLFDAANGRAGQFSFSSAHDTLNTYEWAAAFNKCGGRDGSVTLAELSRTLQLAPRDVHKVFQYIEDVGDNKCDRSWRSAFSHETHRQDESRIDSCEWNELIVALKHFRSDLSDRSWRGISKGVFSGSIARMVTKYYQSKGHRRYF